MGADEGSTQPGGVDNRGLEDGERNAAGNRQNPLEITLQLPYPPSNNSLYMRTARGVTLTRNYRSWIKEAGWALKAQRPGSISGPVDVHMIAVKPDRRKRDVANLEKAVSDLLVRHRVIEDDSLIRHNTQQWSSEDIAPGVYITIRSVA